MAVVYVFLGLVIFVGFVVLLLAFAYLIVVLFQLIVDEVSDIC